MKKEPWRKMTWDRAGKRWMKRYRGKLYKFPIKEGERPRSQASHDRVWALWLERKAQIDNDAVSELQGLSARAREYSRVMMSLALRAAKEHGSPDEFFRMRCVLDLLDYQERTRQKIDTDHFLAAPWEYEAVFGLDTATLPELPELPPDITMPPRIDAGDVVSETSFDLVSKKYIEHLELTATEGYIANTRRDLKQFLEFAGVAIDVKDAGGRLIDYHAMVVTNANNGKWTKDTARDKIKAVTRFLRWCHANEYIDDIPRCMFGRSLAIPNGPKAIKTYSRDEVKKLLDVADDRERLLILLGLNCGLTFGEIASIKRDELDLDRGTLTRPRSKNRNVENAPIVCYKLWPETIESIRKNLIKEGAKLFNVGQSKHEGIYFVELMKRAGLERGRSQKHLRKTGSTILRRHPTYMNFYELYLSHTPKSTADIYYAEPSMELFHEALMWMREQIL